MPAAELSPVDCGNGSNVIASLAPQDAPVVCTATYVATQQNITNGQVPSVATVRAFPFRCARCMIALRIRM